MQPKLRPITNTGITLNKLFEGSALIQTGTNFWVNGVASVINDLTADGADRMILNYWAVPVPYIASISDVGYTPSASSGGGVSSIANSVYNNTFDWTMQAGYHNKKLYYGQAITITVFNPVSGERLTKQCWQVRDENITPGSGTTIPCSYSISADIRPDGAPIFAWKNENGLPYHGFPETIEGGNWQKMPISANTYSGSRWDKRSLAMQMDILKSPIGEETRTGLEEYLGESGANAVEGAIRGAVGGAISQFAGPLAGAIAGTAGVNAAGKMPTGLANSIIPRSMSLSMVGGAVMGGLSATQAMYALKQQEKELAARASVAHPVLTMSTSNYLRECGYNAFYTIISSYSDTDLRAFDDFLTKYGYNVGNKAFEESDFYSRSHFNYVKLKSIIMKSDRSMWMRNVAEEQLLRGVRIWHEYPSRGAIADGNPVA